MQLLLLSMLMACGDRDDTSTPAAESDCTDGTDNDSDGLADCEDEDCFEVCIEDCADGTDNDGDGLADCDDDECYGIEGCTAAYAVTMATTFTNFPGYNYPMYLGWGDGVEGGAGQRAILSANGSIELVANPLGWEGDGFSCAADFYLLSYGSLPLGDVGMSYLGGSDGTVDYSFAVAPDPSDGSLTWKGSCPISTLPPFTWGFTAQSNTFSRQDSSGSWYTQYGANVTTVFYSTDATTMGLGAISQYGPVTWEGVW